LLYHWTLVLTLRPVSIALSKNLKGLHLNNTFPITDDEQTG